MNFRLLAFALGEIAVIIGALMSIPLFMAIGYKEDTTILGFGIAIGVCLLLGVVGIVVRPKKTIAICVPQADLRCALCSGFLLRS